MTQALTVKAIERLTPAPPGKSYYRWDGTLRAFGVRVTATGHKSFIAMARQGRRVIRVTVGDWPTMTLADAREAGRQAILAVRKGRDPNAEKRQARLTRDQQRADRFEAIAEQFIADYCQGKRKDGSLERRYGPELERIMRRDVLPRWRHRSVHEITAADVTRLIRDKRAVAPVQANRVLGLLKVFFGWAVVADNPAKGMKPPTKELARDRVLTKAELRTVWLAADAIGWPFGAIAKLLILTGARLNEVAGMAWPEIDAKAGLWTVPSQRVKNGRTHLVHLAPLTLGIIASVPKIDNCELLFTTTGKTAVSGFSKAKRKIDAEIARLAQAGEAGMAAPWTFHDLRRTVASLMADPTDGLNIAPHVVDKILNHVSGTITGVAAIYNRSEYLSERKNALTAWANWVDALINPKAANIIRLDAARAG